MTSKLKAQVAMLNPLEEDSTLYFSLLKGCAECTNNEVGVHPDSKLHKDNGTAEISARINRWLLRFFTRMSGLISRQPLVFATFALFLSIALLSGSSLAVVESDFVKLFSGSFSEFTAHEELFNEAFGGLPRDFKVILEDDTKSSILAHETLDGLRSIMTRSMRENEIDTSGILVNYTDIESWNSENPNQITLFSEVELAGTFKRYSYRDVCQQSYVPILLRPRDVEIGGNIANHIAFGYHLLNKCLNNTISRPSGVLPGTWGIDRFPCERKSIFDCFQEGNFDYPLNLKQLEAVATEIYQVKRESDVGIFGEIDPYTSCLSNIQESLTTDIADTLFLTTASAQRKSSQIIQILDDKVIEMFAGWGYRHRPRYSDMSLAEIYNFLTLATANEINPSFSAQNCTIKTPCCRKWDGTFVPVNHIVSGDLNDTFTATMFTGQLSHQDHPTMKRIGSQTESEEDSTSQLAAKSSIRGLVVSQFEQRLIDFLTPLEANEPGSFFGQGEAFESLSLKFMLRKSYDDMMSDASKLEPSIVFPGFVFSVLVVAFIGSKYEFPFHVEYGIYSRVILHVCGFILTILSTFSGFGAMGILGFQLTVVSFATVPFLNVGLGMSAMILVSTVLDSFVRYQDAPLQRVKHTMGIAGPIIVSTMVILLSFFAISGNSSITLIRGFCYQMSVTTVTTLFLILFVFLPIVYFESMRVKARKTDLCMPPCVIIKKKPREEARFASVGRRLQLNVDKHFSRWIRRKDFKIAIVLGVGGFSAILLISAFQNLEYGFDMVDLSSDGSYQHSFLVSEREHFKHTDVFLTTIPTLTNGSFSTQSQSILLDAVSTFATHPDFGGLLELRRGWFTNLLSFANNNDTSTRLIDDSSPFLSDKSFQDGYFTIASAFLLTQGSRFLQALSCVDSASKELYVPCSDDFSTDGIFSTTVYYEEVPWTYIAASVHPISAKLVTEYDQVIMGIGQLESILNQVEVNPEEKELFIYSFEHAVYEHTSHVWTSLLLIGIGGTVMKCVVAFIFQASVKIALIQGLTTLLVVVQYLGLLALRGTKMNAFALVSLCATIAFETTFSSFMCFLFMKAQGEQNDRIQTMLGRAVSPILYSSVAAVVPFFMSAASKYPFVVEYFSFLFGAAVALPVLNTVLLLPVVLVYFGPAQLPELEEIRGQPRAVTHSPLELHFIPTQHLGTKGFKKDFPRGALTISVASTMRPRNETENPVQFTRDTVVQTDISTEAMQR